MTVGRDIPLVALTAIAISALSACGDGSDSRAPHIPTEAERIANYQVMAQNAMKASLRDPDGVKYEDVDAYRVEVDGTVIGYAFCGRMNAKNGFGGYNGFERFVAGPTMVGTEETVSGFDKVWTRLCSPAEDAGPVAF
jgi:hypothetical protein